MWLLGIGAAIGIGMAAYNLVLPRQGPGSALPDGLVARVNGHVIRREDYLRMLGALRNDRRNPIGEPDRRRVLERLVDEELLVQRGIELGLARSDTTIRAQVTRAVIASVVAEVQDLQPTGEELRQFYDKNRDFFTQTGDIRVRQVFVRTTAVKDPDGERRAQEAAARLHAGEDFDAVRSALGDPELSPLPDVPLPPSKLREYFGPTALRTVLNLPTGEFSQPVRSGTGYHVLQVLERQAEAAPPFSTMLSEVEAEFRRRRGEEAVRSYLDELRGRAEIAVASPLP
jgi:parvulin-like peptidyl-prolyl isomerase